MSHNLLINGAQSHTNTCIHINILTSESGDSHLSDKEKANLYLSLTHKHPVCVLEWESRHVHILWTHTVSSCCSVRSSGNLDNVKHFYLFISQFIHVLGQLTWQKQSRATLYEKTIHNELNTAVSKESHQPKTQTVTDRCRHREGLTGLEQQGGTDGRWYTLDVDYMFSLSDGFKSGTVSHVLWSARGKQVFTPAKHNIDLTDELHFSSLRWANQWDLLQSCLDAMEVFLSLCDSSAESIKATAPSLALYAHFSNIVKDEFAPWDERWIKLISWGYKEKEKHMLGQYLWWGGIDCRVIRESSF